MRVLLGIFSLVILMGCGGKDAGSRDQSLIDASRDAEGNCTQRLATDMKAFYDNLEARNVEYNNKVNAGDDAGAKKVILDAADYCDGYVAQYGTDFTCALNDGSEFKMSRLQEACDDLRSKAN